MYYVFTECKNKTAIGVYFFSFLYYLVILYSAFFHKKSTRYINPFEIDIPKETEQQIITQKIHLLEDKFNREIMSLL